MKKWIVIAFSLVILFLVGIYFFIPDKIVVTRAIAANANQSGVYRFLSDASNWSLWWPDSSSTDKGANPVFESGGYRFEKTTQGYNSFEVIIKKNGAADSSVLHLFSWGIDSLTIEWGATINTGSNPLNKIRQFFKAENIGKKLEVILAAMQKYISNVKNIYGIDIKQEKMQIDFMVSIKKSFDRHPTTEDIYAEIDQIKKFIAQTQAIENNYPVLNISARDTAHFELVVALPVDRQVRNSGIFTERRMLKNGNLLVAEIRGGKNTVDSALKQIDIYARDHKYLNVALPFQQFMTDRIKVTDTSKWTTRIGYPIL
jgi:hypothetical protein